MKHVHGNIRYALAATVLALAACGGGNGNAPDVHADAAPPGAQLWANIRRGIVGFLFQFWGQGVDPDGGIVTYSWDFDGDGTPDSILQNPTHAYDSEGVKKVTLTVTDDEGVSTTVRMTVAVSSPAPDAQLRAFTLMGAAALEVLLRADGTGAVRYDWDFENDGKIDASGPSPSITRLYPASGLYTARVVANDAAGASSDATVALVVCHSGHILDGPATAMIVADGPLAGAAPHSVTLTAVGSDMDGGTSTATWTWDADGDGRLEGTASGRTITISGLSAGPHRIELRVADDNGNEPGIAELTAVGLTSSELAAWAFADTIHASPFTPIQFHARGENGTLTYAWDFDGDGTIDATTADPIWSYGTPGYYTARVLVSDGTRTALASLSVRIDLCGHESGPYFFYDCDELVIYHGGTGFLSLQPKVSVGGSYPKFVQLRSKAGNLGIGMDTPAGEIVVDDGAGGVAPSWMSWAQPPPPAPNGAAPPSPIQMIRVTSIATHESQDQQYFITIRLIDPGVRVQILTCIVWVLHERTDVELLKIEKFGENSFRGRLKVEIKPQNVGILAPNGPDIYSVVIWFGQQTPKWVSVDLSSCVLPEGWAAEQIPGGVRFYWTGNGGSPLKHAQGPKSFDFDFVTEDGKPCAGDVELRDENNQRVGREHMNIVGF